MDCMKTEKGKTGPEIVKNLIKGSKGIIEHDYDCTQCKIYEKIKPNYEKNSK